MQTTPPQTTNDPWVICRHPRRPTALDCIQNIFTSFEELHGDRLSGDDAALIGGLGMLEDQKVILLAQEKGRNTSEYMQRNFGMMHPEGYRKALRLMQLAERFTLPILTFIDTKGAYPGLEAEERGQAWAISQNINAMLTLKAPIIGLLLGEGCSGGALGIGIVDTLSMLEHSYYTVISPESCAAILWRDTNKTSECAKALRMSAQDMLHFQVADHCIPEPPGGAHTDPDTLYKTLKNHLLEQIHNYTTQDYTQLPQTRQTKYRTLGAEYLL